MGTVIISTNTDPIEPAYAPPREGEHVVVARSTWNTVLTCSCGVFARADRERRVWAGEDGHVLPFGTDTWSFAPAAPDEPPAAVLDGQDVYTPQRRTQRTDVQLQVMKELGIDPASVHDGGEEPPPGPSA